MEALDEARGAVGGGNCMVELVDYRMVWYGNCMEDYGMGCRFSDVINVTSQKEVGETD